MTGRHWHVYRMLSAWRGHLEWQWGRRHCIFNAIICAALDARVHVCTTSLFITVTGDASEPDPAAVLILLSGRVVTSV
jgi:hypothetical protein